MKPNAGNHDSAASLAVLEQVARTALGGEVLPAQHERGRARLLEAQGRSTRHGGITLGLAAAFALCALLFGAWFASPRALTFEARGVRVQAGGYVERLSSSDSPGTSTDEAALAFSDGTRVTLAPGTRGRIGAVTERGAEVGIESGSATFSVRKKPGARWSVVAGPYVIRVTGTVFTASWSPDDGLLRVDLREGSVVVEGPTAIHGVALAAGQQLLARAKTGELRIRGLDDQDKILPNDSPIGAEVASQPTGDVKPLDEPSVPGPKAAESVTARPSSWTELVRIGRSDSVLSEATARGIDTVVGQASLSDLSALADAARYSGRGAIAERALLAQVSRFSGSPEARTALFLLGRIFHDQRGSLSEAVRYYDRYLAEAPGGALASEALGRKLVALRALGRTDETRRAAETYLERHPDGAFASDARKVLEP